MTPAEWKRVEELFHAARQRPPEERTAFLDEACREAPALRERVEALLRSSSRAETFMGSPAVGTEFHVDDALRMAVNGDHFLEGENPASRAGAQNDALPAGVAWAPDGRMPPTDLTPGYRILKELHRGGQGVVYEAIQESTKRKVALKVMLEGPFAGPASKRRFEREIELVASLRHPNIVPIFDSGVARGQFYYAMEYVQGETLSAYVLARKLTVDDILRLFHKVSVAVDHAHQQGVIHRDLKPSNILVDADGEPHVLDFGLAKVA